MHDERTTTSGAVIEPPAVPTPHHRESDAVPELPTEAAALHVRTADIEPYTGLRYLSKLFRVMALIMVLMLVAEVVTGLVRQGMDAIPTLVAEVSRLFVLAGVLWGVGDLAMLLVDIGHDMRAMRVLMSRQMLRDRERHGS